MIFQNSLFYHIFGWNCLFHEEEKTVSIRWKYINNRNKNEENKKNQSKQFLSVSVLIRSRMPKWNEYLSILWNTNEYNNRTIEVPICKWSLMELKEKRRNETRNFSYKRNTPLL